MAVFRVEKNQNYTVMANYHLKDASLSLKAKGLLSLMLSLPDDWDYSLLGLVKICKEEIASISSGVKELENAGYIVRHQERDDKGRMSNIVYTIYEKPINTGFEPYADFPHTDNPHTENPHAENPITDNPITEDPISENPHESNTKQQSTKQQNTKEQRRTDFLTERARESEEDLDQLLSEISETIGRPLNLKEKRICSMWIEAETDHEMIMLAVEDNLFRGDMFNLKHVVKTLDEWKSSGISDPIAARNYILDNHVANLDALAGNIEARSHKSGKREEILNKNELADLQSYRDAIISEYNHGAFNKVIDIYGIAYHKNLFDYLPKEIQGFIKKNNPKGSGIAGVRL